MIIKSIAASLGSRRVSNDEVIALIEAHSTTYQGASGAPPDSSESCWNYRDWKNGAGVIATNSPSITSQWRPTMPYPPAI